MSLSQFGTIFDRLAPAFVLFLSLTVALATVGLGA
jgi:hypothetical protein